MPWLFSRLFDPIWFNHGLHTGAVHNLSLVSFGYWDLNLLIFEGGCTWKEGCDEGSPKS